MVLNKSTRKRNEKNTVTRSQRVLKKKMLRVGDVCNLQITALAANNIGMDEYSFPFAVFVPNAKLGSKIKAKILKIQESSYAIGELLEDSNLEKGSSSNEKEFPVNAGDVLTVSITKKTGKGNAGIVELVNGYNLLIPLSGEYLESKKLENVKVVVTRVKQNYAFAKIEKQNNSLTNTNVLPIIVPSITNESSSKNKVSLEVGSKFTTTLPVSSLDQLSTFTKGKGKFVVLNVNGSVLFLKLKKGKSLQNSEELSSKNNTNLGLHSVNSTSASYGKERKLRVRVKITSKSANCAVGKILQLNPVSKAKKVAVILKNIREMVNHGMHFGEKAVKCHARMKNYIWSSKTASKSQTSKFGQNSNQQRPLIKKDRHIINLFKTRRCLNQASNKLTKYALKGRTFLFVGTKKPAADLVARASLFTKNSFYVNTRWLGGMLTNWKTICKSISKIRPILKEKEKVVRDILERRQAIKKRLIKKAFLLRKKSKFIISKGRILLETIEKEKLGIGGAQSGLSSTPLLSSFLSSTSVDNQNDSDLTRNSNVKKLTSLRNEFLTKGTQYLKKRQKLIKKRRELIYQTLLLKEKGLDLSLKHKAILNQLVIYAKKLREYKYLLILTSEIKNIKTTIASSNSASQKGVSKQSSKSLLSVSYSKLKQVGLLDQNNVNTNSNWILPNPPKEILNKIVSTCLNTSANAFLVNESKLAMASSELNNSKENQFIVCSTLISKFSEFNKYIKSVIHSLISSIQALETQAKIYSTQLNKIKTTLQTYLTLKQKYVAELQLLKVKFIKERSIIKIVRRKLKAIDAQKRLLKFIPRLRYLPTPQTKISKIVQILLSRIVDPKLKYPIESIYDQRLSSSSKKVAAAYKKKWQRLEKYFGGIANMTKLTKSQISRNVAIIIGQKEEINAVRECQKLGIKLFTIVDTNCNPTLSDHIIPANDDSRSSIKYILTKFITRIRLAHKLRSRLSIYTTRSKM